MSDLTTQQIIARIRAKYPPASHAMFTEVRNGGVGATRSCDVMLMSLWQSNGLELHGMEVKASRADWLRELKQPNKSDEFLAVCDRWWLVTGSREIAKREEIPSGWGWLAPRGDGLAVVKQAPQLDALPLDRATLSSILRRAVDTSATDMLLMQRYRQGVTDGKAIVAHVDSGDTQSLQQLRDVVAQFERASGIHLSEYTSHVHARKYGSLLSAIMHATYPLERASNTLAQAAMTLDSQATAARKIVAQLDELAKAFPSGDVSDDAQVANASKTEL